MKKYYFAVITKVPDLSDDPDDVQGNYAVGDLLISQRRKASHIVGSGLFLNPSLRGKEYEDLLGKALCHVKVDPSEDHIIFCSVPVFEEGEILIMDSRTDRTIPDGRKPDKWDVKYECFDDVADAIERAKAVVTKVDEEGKATVAATNHIHRELPDACSRD